MEKMIAEQAKYIKVLEDRVMKGSAGKEEKTVAGNVGDDA
jgi:hypothetical protein